MTINLIGLWPVLRFLRIFYRAGVVFVLAAFFVIGALLPLNNGAALAHPADYSPQNFYVSQTITLTAGAVGDPLPRIQCGTGYSATIYAQGLSAPDGLAFGPDGLLYVAEETSGEVSQIDATGAVTAVITGLSNPEGIAFDGSGNLYVVEDIDNGRIVKRATNGAISTLTTGLDAPEGIVWNSSDNQLYVTESNLEYAVSTSSITPTDYRTHVTKVSLAGVATRILTKTAVFTPGSPLKVTFWSYAGIAVGPDGNLYFANELSGQTTDGTYFGVNYQADSTDSVFTATTASIPTAPTAFANNQLIAPEGLRFSGSGSFPLYVAEEDIGGGAGRLSKVQSNGSHSPFCTGFFSIEDVALDANGRIYVSEDESGNGKVILIEQTTTSVWLPVILR